MPSNTYETIAKLFPASYYEAMFNSEDYRPERFLPVVADRLGETIESVAKHPKSHILKMFSNHILFGPNADHFLKALNAIEHATKTEKPFGSPLHTYGLYESETPSENSNTLRNLVFMSENSADTAENVDEKFELTNAQYLIHHLFSQYEGRRRYAGEAYRQSVLVKYAIMQRDNLMSEASYVYPTLVDRYQQCFNQKLHPEDPDFIVRPKPVDPDLEELNLNHY